MLNGTIIDQYNTNVTNVAATTAATIAALEEQRSAVTPSAPAPLRGAIIVGASSGIGAALARELAARGYMLALVARRAAALDALCAEINAAVPPLLATQPGAPNTPTWGKTARGLDHLARAYTHDVRDYAATPDLYAHIQRELADDGVELRLLVYAAGVMPSPQDGAWSFEDERAMMETNTLGAMRWLNLGAETFTRQGQGALVGISSVAGDRGRKGNSAYMASKAALSVYLESLRYRLHAGAGKGVRVVTVKPGYVATPLLADATPPAALVASATSVARRIANACERGPEVVYVPGWWALVMAGVRALPGAAMTRLPI